MEGKDLIAICGIGATFVIGVVNLLHSLSNERRTSFINTVTASRLKWIDSLRDNVSEVIAVISRLADEKVPLTGETKPEMILRRDTLVHQIVLHLNPVDPEDQRIRILVDQIRELSDSGAASREILEELTKLRNATSDYLKKEWNRVKKESTRGAYQVR